MKHEMKLKRSIAGLKDRGTSLVKPSQNEEEYFKRLDVEKIKDIREKKIKK